MTPAANQTPDRRCVSCGARINPRERVGACDHGFICDQCLSLGSECPTCARAEEDERDRRAA